MLRMSRPPFDSRTKQRWLIALAAGSGIVIMLAIFIARVVAKPQEPTLRPAQPTTGTQAPQTVPAQAVQDAVKRSTPPTAAAAMPGTLPAAGAPAPPKPPQDPHRARITFTTIPMTNAKVVWGKQTLGSITPKQALTIVRPRDTGPLDVMVYAPGFLPVQTRAHTFEDSQIIVKLTTPENKQTLWGYRAPLDAGVTPADQLPAAPPEESSGQPPL